MTPDLLLNLVALAFAAAFTPGPNNALLASSGASFGLRRTVPHILGITFGFPLMVFLVGLFLGQAFQASWLLREGLRWFGAALLLWIAWKLWSAGGAGSRTGRMRPFTFVEAAGFQWINPKGWAMAIAVTAQFIGGEAPLRTALVVTAVFFASAALSASSWAAAGSVLTRWLEAPGRLKLFNRAMAALIALSVGMLFTG